MLPATDHWRELRKVIFAEAQATVLLADLWTTRSVAQVVKEKFSIEHTPDHFGLITVLA